jgi:peptide/nickel transport system ATP-binding protein
MTSGTSGQDQALLTVRDLTVAYRSDRAGAVAAVRGVSFDIAPGELVSLVGESGSGKTSSAKAILGLLDPSVRVSGTVRLGGRSLVGLSERQWRSVRGKQLGFVPQDPTVGLNPTRRVGRQIAEALQVHEKSLRGDALQRRVVELLDRMGLPQPELRARQYPHELSGGMRQRVLIAAALANRPQLVVADEPTSALDVTVQRQILDHIDELRRDLGVAVLLITHDLGVAGDRSDRIVVLSQGAVVETGDPVRILRTPTSDYTRRLVAAVPTVDHGRLGAAPEPGRELLSGTDLVRVFGGGRGQPAITAVQQVSVTVRTGTTVGVVGESGSGKSTLARLLTRLSPVDGGRVRLDGEDITEVSGEELRQLRRRIQIVYQNPYASLDPRFSIARTLVEPLRAFGIGDRAARRARAAELLDLVGLPVEFLDRRPAELSGGQLQRVAIARALATEPELVVLDEAVSALDVSVQAQILRLLVRLQSELGVTLVFISHDLAVIRQISDTVVVMQHGKVVESGPADDIFDRPRTDYTRALLAAIPGRRLAPAKEPVGHTP